MSALINSSIPSVSSVDSVKPATESKPQATGFGDVLKSVVGEAEKLQVGADNAVNAFASGEQQDIHSTMIALEKADVSFQLISQVRNKVISAYETIMRMQV